jgi:AcrR family transcriptional regulator
MRAARPRGVPSPAEYDFFDDVPSPSQRRLLGAALESFAELGYEATTTRNIAARASMSNAAIYTHYRSKQELLFEISFAVHRRMLEELHAVMHHESPPRKRLDAIVRLLVQQSVRRRVASRLASRELRSLDPEQRRMVLDIRRQTEQVIRDVLTEGLLAGQIDVDDVDLTTVAILSMTVDVARWYSPATRWSADHLAEHYAELIDRMVTAQRSGGT